MEIKTYSVFYFNNENVQITNPMKNRKFRVGQTGTPAHQRWIVKFLQSIFAYTYARLKIVFEHAVVFFRPLMTLSNV